MARPRHRAAIGILIGLAGTVVVLSMLGGGRGGAGAGPLLSDCNGTIRELVIHYVPQAAQIVARTYRDFLAQLASDVTVYVVCPDRPAFDDLVARVGRTRCALLPVAVGHPITAWSRDRWLALAPPENGGAVTLLYPRGERAAEVWPEREGDRRVAGDLSAALGRKVACTRSSLYFDGGDFTADDRTVFVAPSVLPRNLQRTVKTREELLADLSGALKRRVVLLADAPDHHAGMYMMPVGDNTVLVGDPGAGRKLLGATADNLCPPDGPDFSETTQARFDAVAAQCRSAGYRVIRMPLVPGRDGRTYLTSLNAILDRRRGRRIVYMPVFGGADALNQAAASIWQEAGYEVRPVDCSGCCGHFGSLRCLVNVLRRE